MKSLLGVLAVAVTVMTLNGCGGVTRNSVAAAADTVTFATEKLTDTSSFIKRSGDRVAIYAEATINYPATFRDSATIAELQRLFVHHVLYMGDSLTLQEAMHAYVGNTMHQYDMTPQPVEGDTIADEENDEEEIVYKYNTSTTITPMRNDHGIVTFARVEVVKKNDQITSVTHRYYTIDLHNMVLVDQSKVFRDDALGDVCQLMKAQLLRQNQVTADEQLNELGFFNADNITVTRNFYFDEQGVTWSFLPGELAVEAVGEPHITIPYDALEPYACDGSIMNRLK